MTTFQILIAKYIRTTKYLQTSHWLKKSNDKRKLKCIVITVLLSNTITKRLIGRKLDNKVNKLITISRNKK